MPHRKANPQGLAEGSCSLSDEGAHTEGVQRYWWVTNYAAPYRLPVWEHIAKRSKLSILLLENHSNSSLKSQNRSDDWRISHDATRPYEIAEWPTARIVRGESVTYVSRSFFPRKKAPHAVLLGGWESPAYWQFLAGAKIRGIRTVGFYESTLSSNKFSSGPVAWARKWFFRSMDAVVVPGSASRTAIEAMGVEAARIHQGFNAVDVQAIHEQTTKLRAVASESVPPEREGPHKFIYIGQLIERKNVRSLLRAFESMAALNDSLSIVGAGPQDSALRAEAATLGIGQKVSFHGPVPYGDLPQLLSNHETLILPSSEEVWGLVVNEALAGGLHCVVTGESGVAESVRGMRGVYISSTSVESLSLCMRKSRSEWTGPITHPEILVFTPQRLADVFLSALAGENRL